MLITMEGNMKLGIDIGSTTVKLVLINDENAIVFKRYERHMSNILGKVHELLEEMQSEVGNLLVNVAITGSGGLSLSKILGSKFEQEVIACSRAVDILIPKTAVAIELAGEHAKIPFLGATIQHKMNATRAGG